MAENLLNLHMSDRAEMGYSMAGPEGRRELESWFAHLRNWRNDDYLRSLCRRVKFEENKPGETYMTPSTGPYVIAFTIVGDELTVISILNSELVRMVQTAKEQSVP